MIDIKNHPEVLEAMNAILNNGGVCEVKREKWKAGEKIVVVEQTRAVKLVYPPER